MVSKARTADVHGDFTIKPGKVSAARGAPNPVKTAPASKSRSAMGSKVGFDTGSSSSSSSSSKRPKARTKTASTAKATKSSSGPQARPPSPAGTVKGSKLIAEGRAAAAGNTRAKQQQKLALERMLKASRKG